MNIKLDDKMRPRKGFPTGIPTGNTRSYFVRDGETRKVIVEVVAKDHFDLEHEVCSLRMTPDEARSFARVLVDMAGMAEAPTPKKGVF